MGAWAIAVVADVSWLTPAIWTDEWWLLLLGALFITAAINIFARSLNNIDKYFEALLRKKEELEADDARP